MTKGGGGRGGKNEDKRDEGNGRNTDKGAAIEKKGERGSMKG